MKEKNFEVINNNIKAINNRFLETNSTTIDVAKEPPTIENIKIEIGKRLGKSLFDKVQVILKNEKNIDKAKKNYKRINKQKMQYGSN